MILQTKDYNSLIPPSNPDFPWKAKGWQLLCYYCAQPIHYVVDGAGYRQRTLAQWEHVDGGWACVTSKLRPTAEIDDVRCDCGTQSNEHNRFCSRRGKPSPYATPMSDKEQELINAFGWAVKEALS